MKVRDHVNMVHAQYTIYISSHFSLPSFGRAPSSLKIFKYYTSFLITYSFEVFFFFTFSYLYKVAVIRNQLPYVIRFDRNFELQKLPH